VRPVPRAGNKAGERERPWRVHLASCVAAPRGPGLQAGLPRDTQISLEVHFFVATPQVDLDNLAKPVLDTLSEPTPPESRPSQRRERGPLRHPGRSRCSTSPDEDLRIRPVQGGCCHLWDLVRRKRVQRCVWRPGNANRALSPTGMSSRNSMRRCSRDPRGSIWDARSCGATRRLYVPMVRGQLLPRTGCPCARPLQD
jgi:hypothetical protein